MSVDALDSGSHFEIAAAGQGLTSGGPLADLPRLSRHEFELESRLRRTFQSGTWASAGLPDSFDGLLTLGPAEVLWRASGLRRPGLIAQISWPRLSTRLALGIETPIAHAIVDRLLGFDRLDVEGRLQLTPVEWGVLTYFLARGLAHLGEKSGSLGAWDITLDRAGPDPFDARGLGALVTLRWPVQVGSTAGNVRIWLTESLVMRWLATEARPDAEIEPTAQVWSRYCGLSSVWRAEAGTVEMPRGLGRLRVGGVLPLSGSQLRGSPQSPQGPVRLGVAIPQRATTSWFPTEPVPLSGGGRLTLTGPRQHAPMPREPLTVIPPQEPMSTPSPTGLSPSDVPVTLVVELGRVNLTLTRLADLKPGDVIELGRHSREPVELTSGGRLVARGELVQIDTELGVRLTSVFL